MHDRDHGGLITRGNICGVRRGVRSHNVRRTGIRQTDVNLWYHNAHQREAASCKSPVLDLHSDRIVVITAAGAQ